MFELGLAFALMALAYWVATKLRVSVVPLLIVTGMAVGPHLPKTGPFNLQFVESGPYIAFLGRVGVLFLLFYLGLEFSVGRLVKAGRAVAIAGSLYIALNIIPSLLFGVAMGWNTKDVMAGIGIMLISSSAITAKVLVDLKRTANPETELILGITMAEDIFLAAYLSVISGILLSGATSLGTALVSVSGALGVVGGAILLGQRAVPLFNRLLNIADPELFIVILAALLFLVAGTGEFVHVADAIGALLAGLILAETDYRERIEHLIIPLRDLFGAVFFFSFGLAIDPRSLLEAAVPATIAALVMLVCGTFSGLVIGRVSGLSPRASTNIGLTLAARGEFSIIVANLAQTAGLSTFLQPFAALYVLILAIVAPILTKESRVVYQLVRWMWRWSRPTHPPTTT